MWVCCGFILLLTGCVLLAPQYDEYYILTNKYLKGIPETDKVLITNVLLTGSENDPCEEDAFVKYMVSERFGMAKCYTKISFSDDVCSSNLFGIDHDGKPDIITVVTVEHYPTRNSTALDAQERGHGDEIPGSERKLKYIIKDNLLTKYPTRRFGVCIGKGNVIRGIFKSSYSDHSLVFHE
jgi:hypothetical protein